MEQTSYVYVHLTADERIPFYVGKGFGDRAYRKFRNNWWQNIVNKHGYTVEFIQKGLSDEEAIALEIEMIAKIGRRDQGKGTLVNLTDGGEGTKNPSPETRKKLSENWLGKKHSEATKKKLSERATGRKKSEAHKQALSESQKGSKQTVETIEKRRKALQGITHKDKGAPMSEDWKKAISESLKGKARSEEHRKKLSDAAKAAHARKKLISNCNCG